MIPDPLRYMLGTNSVVGVHPIWLQNLVARTDLVRRVGGFDPAFRLAMTMTLLSGWPAKRSSAFVNMPMVLIDRTLPAERHVGASKNWDDADFSSSHGPSPHGKAPSD